MSAANVGFFCGMVVIGYINFQITRASSSGADNSEMLLFLAIVQVCAFAAAIF